VTAGIAVFDRRTGQFVRQSNADHRFRSASVAKLLIVLDFLWDRGPAYDVPPADRARLDGFDQFFGIPSVFERDFSIKQGWSGFQGSSGYRSDQAKPADAPVDLVSEALHTTGTVGPDDRSIVAVFTLHPPGTEYEKAYAEVTRLTAALTVPGVTDRR
jgi:hypothetical protein